MPPLLHLMEFRLIRVKSLPITESKFDTGHEINKIGITAGSGGIQIIAGEKVRVTGGEREMARRGVGDENVEFTASVVAGGGIGGTDGSGGIGAAPGVGGVVEPEEMEVEAGGELGSRFGTEMESDVMDVAP